MIDKIVDKILEDIEAEILDRDDSIISFNPSTQSAYVQEGTDPSNILSSVMEDVTDEINERLSNNDFYDEYYIT